MSVGADTLRPVTEIFNSAADIFFFSAVGISSSGTEILSSNAPRC